VGRKASHRINYGGGRKGVEKREGGGEVKEKRRLALMKDFELRRKSPNEGGYYTPY